MKLDFNRKYTTIAIYACLVVVFAVLLVFAFVHISALGSALATLRSILYPIIYGVLIAYLINPIYKFAYNEMFAFIGRKKNKKKLRGAVSLAITYFFVLAVLAGFFAIIVPQIVSSYLSLQDQVKKYIVDASAWVNEIIASSDLFEGRFDITKYFNLSEISGYLQKLLSNSYTAFSSVVAFLSGFFNGAKNWIVGLIISIYLLASKDILSAQLEKTIYAFLKKENAKSLVDFAKDTDKTFGKFLLGKILDSLIIGVITFVVMTVIRMPYAPLISLIIGVTNIIPFFGPFIGAIPSVFIVLIADPKMAVWALLAIIVIQQLDGNLIGPKIIGNSTGVSSLWIIVSIIIFGGLFGIVGMVIAVPAFAIIYKWFKRIVEKKLDDKGMSTNTMDYLREKCGDLDDPRENKASGTKKKI